MGLLDELAAVYGDDDDDDDDDDVDDDGGRFGVDGGRLGSRRATARGVTGGDVVG